MKRRKKTILLLYSILLAAFSVYFLLDTFVIERVYSTEVSAVQSAQTGSSADETQPADTSPGNTDGTSADPDSTTQIPGSEDVFTTAAAPAVTPVITEDSYNDGNISIKITEYRQNDTTIYAADIQLSSAEYLKTALAKGVFGRNVTAKTSATAADNGAILAINGDYYGSQERGYVIRGGVIYRSTAVSGRQDLVIYEDGSMEVIYETDISAEELLAKGARDVLSFGPELLKDGKIAVNSSYEVARATNSNPRTAIGIIDELHYVFLVSDGRTSESAGLSVYELAEFMQSLGVRTAYNLDGGGSSTMYFNGQVINDPVGGGRGQSERSVSDIVYIGY
ncbi:MAG: phosphodiester glycosidase family protein [Clostridia bacterium]|nr:phosphodiester glycosidase family protein [Clostridia bacterium]